MLKTAFKTFLGSRHKREAKKLQPLIDEINEICEGLSSLSDDELRAKTDGFRGYVEERTSDLKSQIGELKEEKRHSEDPSERERLSFDIGGLERQLLDEIENTL